MKNGVIAGIVVAAVIGIGAFVLSSKDDNPATTETTTESTTHSEQQSSGPSQADEIAEATAFTAENIAIHSNAEDCWTIVNGSVYDITSYVPKHPGGDEILAACGADGTSLFTQRQTASGQSVGSGTPHSGDATDQLAVFKLGELAQ